MVQDKHTAKTAKFLGKASNGNKSWKCHGMRPGIRSKRVVKPLIQSRPNELSFLRSNIAVF